jgi:cytochrome bd-type quinol oxidase subunit 2
VRLSDNYPLSLFCVTVFLMISYASLKILVLSGLALVATILGFLVALASATRTIYPKVRNSSLYQILMLFDMTALAQIVRKRMDEIKGKGKKMRQDMMVFGTIVFPISVFWMVGQFFQGGTYFNMDNGVSVYVPALAEEVTNVSIFTLILAIILFVLSILLIEFGFYGKFGKWLGVREYDEK